MARTLIVLVLLVWPSAALAEGNDGAYGRLEGDLALDLAVGGGVAFENDRVLGAATIEARARYLDVGGLVLGGDVRPDGASRIWLGVDVRPLFLGRFLMNLGFGDRFWDLLVDSIGFDLGVAFVPLDEAGGAALAFGFGLDVPLVFFGDGIEGLSLRFAGRHVAALATDRFGPDGGVNDWIAMSALVLRLATRTGLPAWEPSRYQRPDD